MASSYFMDSWLAKRNPMDYVKDKKLSSKVYINYMMIRLQKMFKYTNLPDTIPREMLEYYLQVNGSCLIARHSDGNLYAFTGSYGGEPDAYYRPTIYVVANPALKLSKDFKIGEDGVIIRNDSLWMGLYPLMARYASLMAENILTIRSADVMLRVLAMLTAPDDKTKIAAESYLKKLENGEFGVIGENRFFDGVKMQSPPSNNGSYLTQFIELHQYLKGSFYNEIGLNANFNMKREALGDGETSLNEDILLPLCEEMLRCREEDVQKVNEMFGTDIKVEFDSSWAQNILETELALDKMENEASQLATEDTTEVGDGEVVESEESDIEVAESELETETSEDDEEIESTDSDEETEGEEGESSDEKASQLAEEESPDAEESLDEKASQLAEEESSDESASQLAEEIEVEVVVDIGKESEEEDEDE